MIRIGTVACYRVMAVDGVIGQRPDSLVTLGRSKLESTHTDMTGGHTGEYGAGQGGFPVDGFPGTDHRQATRGGYTEPVHGLADEVFPQHGAERCPPIAPAGIGCWARSFELEINDIAIGCNELAEQ